MGETTPIPVTTTRREPFALDITINPGMPRSEAAAATLHGAPPARGLSWRLGFCRSGASGHERLYAVDNRADGLEVFNVFVGVVGNLDSESIFDVKNDHREI